MGRLFWKIFLLLLVAQLAGNVSVAVLFWYERNQREAQFQQLQATDASMPEAAPRPPGPRPFFDNVPPPHPGAGEPPRFMPERRPPAFGFPGLPWPPLIAGALASLIFAAIFARYLSRPIVALRRAFGSVAQGHFDIRPSTEIGRRRDELAELTTEFEHTARQIHQVMLSQRRLLHDVSHEVRSPLARMQLAIDLARQQPDKTEASMQRIERESARIDRLVEELLTLSRLEARACGTLDEEVDIVDLVEQIVEDARFEAAASQRQVEFDAACEASVSGRSDLLHRAIENVVRNALRHTGEGSTVCVSLQAAGRHLCISVEDQGPGLPEAALGAIFEPFVRFGEARGNDGYGLGLAITRHTIEAHGGSVCARNREHGGLRIEMILPANIFESRV